MNDFSFQVKLLAFWFPGLEPNTTAHVHLHQMALEVIISTRDQQAPIPPASRQVVTALFTLGLSSLDHYLSKQSYCRYPKLYSGCPTTCEHGSEVLCILHWQVGMHSKNVISNLVHDSILLILRVPLQVWRWLWGSMHFTLECTMYCHTNLSLCVIAFFTQGTPPRMNMTLSLYTFYLGMHHALSY